MRELKYVDVAWITLKDCACRCISREEEGFVANGQLDDYRVVIGIEKICVFGWPENFYLVVIGLVDDFPCFSKGYLQVIVLNRS